MNKPVNFRTLLVMRGARHNPRTLRTLEGMPVPDQENGDFDNVTTYERKEALLPGTYTFSFHSDAKAEQRLAQRAGYRTTLAHHLGIASPYRELTIKKKVR